MHSKLNGGKNILVGCHFSLLWLRESTKAMTKALEWKNENFVTFIYENNGNEEKTKV